MTKQFTFEFSEKHIKINEKYVKSFVIFVDCFVF